MMDDPDFDKLMDEIEELAFVYEGGVVPYTQDEKELKKWWSDYDQQQEKYDAVEKKGAYNFMNLTSGIQMKILKKIILFYTRQSFYSDLFQLNFYQLCKKYILE